MIVRTLLDTDLYKFTTSYAYIKLFPYAMGTFSFNDRNETEYTEEFLEAAQKRIQQTQPVETYGRGTGIHDTQLPVSSESLLGMAVFFPFLHRTRSIFIWTQRAGCILKSAIFFIKSHCMKYRCSPSYPKSKTSFSAMYPI